MAELRGICAEFFKILVITNLYVHYIPITPVSASIEPKCNDGTVRHMDMSNNDNGTIVGSGGHDHGGGHWTDVLTGTVGNDTLHGGDGVRDISGWAGNDVIYAGVHGGSAAGGYGNDTIYAYGFGAPLPQRFQTHVFGNQGDDTLILDMSRQPGDIYDVRFGHHVFGGEGSDKFVFNNVAGSGQYIIGRLDDFDPTYDSIWVDGQEVDIYRPPENVRVVEFKDQQWLVIDNRIFYSLEGARHRSPTIAADDRNSSTGEENHFIDWPEDWNDGIPSNIDVRYQNPFNFVPSYFTPTDMSFETYFRPNDHMFDGTEGNDKIEGSPSHGQVLRGMNGNDWIFGNRSDDKLYGNAGSDYIDGYHGNDTISGGYGYDTIDGGKGHDVIYGNAGNDVIAGGSDNDTIHGDDGNDTIFGGSEEDLIYGNIGDDMVFAGPGRDRVFGGQGDDTVNGNNDNDFIDGQIGNDRLSGGGGKDTIHGGFGNDEIKGGNGKDLLIGGEGSDRMFGGTGPDRIFGNGGSDRIIGGIDDDFLSGGSDRDHLAGEAGNDAMFGGDGNDRMSGGGGTDRLFGGSGNDFLTGGQQNDVLIGRKGNDTLYGGSGNDRLSGGDGADKFIFTRISDSPYNSSGDVIVDFQIGIDSLNLSALTRSPMFSAHQDFETQGDVILGRNISISHVDYGLEVFIDVDLDGQADLRFSLKGAHDFDVNDIIF
ncbi:calcium-binding protein [Thioclava sp.]|uniref:calcium-binding protein n=1 Tax=Thioclava sp. TaxID=1933450 RepID=UPI0032429BC7